MNQMSFRQHWLRFGTSRILLVTNEHDEFETSRNILVTYELNVFELLLVEAWVFMRITAPYMIFSMTYYLDFYTVLYIFTIE